MRYCNDIGKEISFVAKDAFQRFTAVGVVGLFDESELEFSVFAQLWGSTSLGFGGMGGSAMTTAYTYVVMGPHRQGAMVYFAGRFAYYVKNPSDFFNDCFVKRQMPPVRDVARLEK